MADHTDITQNIGIDLSAWAFKGIVAALAAFGLKLRKDESARVDVALPDVAPTLTLVATDGGDGISHDLLFLGDAREPETHPRDARGRGDDAERERGDEKEDRPCPPGERCSGGGGVCDGHFALC